jgi:SAM-dependent methyltransferase
MPDACFPNMVRGDPKKGAWPYLRAEIPHAWYVDRRRPPVGFVSRDEAALLYNTALRFRGRRALEIGCWLGWSTCHLALAGVSLDVLDPALSDQGIRGSVEASLSAAGVRGRVNLVAAPSPDAVAALAGGRKWALFFVDGSHDAPAPLRDAQACAAHAEDDALVLFHDLAAPAVGEALDWLREQGWRTVIYHTMQVMGAAWRGSVAPLTHTPDPAVEWKLPAHLRDHPIR